MCALRAAPSTTGGAADAGVVAAYLCGMEMERRTLGSSGAEVSALGLGCMGMSEFYGPSDDEVSVGVIHRAIELGITMLDTADVYGPHTNERLVGRAIADRRDEVFLATKFGQIRGPDGAFVGVSGRPSYVRAACDASLRRLGVDPIDLYYQHRVDPDVPIEETVGAMGDLVRAGKVRFIGLSEAAPETVERAHREFPVAALQTEYSLWSREPEAELLPLCRELGIGFVAYSPLGRGFLTGAIADGSALPDEDRRRLFPRFTGVNAERNRRLVARVGDFAKSKGCTPAQLALAWLLAQGPDIVAIPGTRSTARLEENADAVHVELSPDDLATLNDMVPPGAAAGDRYPEASMKTVNR